MSADDYPARCPICGLSWEAHTESREALWEEEQ